MKTAPYHSHHTHTTAWTIAASDCSGGAGIQADLLTFQNLNCHGASILTASTAQNHLGIHDLFPLPTSHLNAQWESLLNALPPKAIKIGVIGNLDQLQWLIKALTAIQFLNIPIIYDPVLKASAGGAFMNENWRRLILEKLCPLLTVITPNQEEASWLAQMTFLDSDLLAMRYQKIAEHFHEYGVKNVVITGGDSNNVKLNLNNTSENNEVSYNLAADYYSLKEDYDNTNKRDPKLQNISIAQNFWLVSPRSKNGPRHGTGCVFSSAITAALATGHEIKESVIIAKSYINQGLRTATPFIPEKLGPLHHQIWEKNSVDWPRVWPKINGGQAQAKTCALQATKSSNANIGIYPLIDNLLTLQQLLDTGITTLQLRVKNQPLDKISNLIKKAVKIVEFYPAKLYINDYWELALEHGAYGVHLGQEDLMTIDPELLLNSPIHLGISARNHWEFGRARMLNPDYIGIGPIFPTSSKKITVAPLGIEKLHYWCRVSDYPIVAIGGIYLEQIHALKKTGIAGIAMISGIMHATDITRAAKKALELWNNSNEE